MKTQNSVLTGTTFLNPTIYLILVIITILIATTFPYTGQTPNRLGYIQFNPIRQVPVLQCLAAPCDISPDWVMAAVTDIFGNIVLFLPFGVAISLMLKQKNWCNRSQILAAFGSGLLFSLCIETAQYWMPTRVTSVHDIIFNSSGALFGALLLTMFYAKYSLLQYRWQTSMIVFRLMLAAVYPLKLQTSPIKYSPSHRLNL